jgi:hypothetical protein
LVDPPVKLYRVSFTALRGEPLDPREVWASSKEEAIVVGAFYVWRDIGRNRGWDRFQAEGAVASVELIE